MPAKIRLQRQGKKGHPYFHIVVADVRAPRDGKYIERIGFYNPNTDPATIEIDVDGAVKWLNKGAQPTDTARAILGYKGVLYKNHLLKGVKKGAFDEAEADKRYQTWLDEKQAKIDGKKSDLVSASTKAAADRKQAEIDKNKERAAAIAAANAPAPEPVVEEAVEATETPVDTAEGEAQVAEATKEAPANEEATAEAQADEALEAAPVEETKAEEPKEEVKAEEPKEEVKAEAKEEEPKAEAEEEPKAEEKEEEKN